MSEDRADYMMEAFLDEQNTLIRPLVSRKLHLVKTLDERASLIERLLEEKRKKFLHSVTTYPPSKKGHSSPPAAELLELIEGLEDELEQLSEEKLGTLNQLMDLVRRPYDTILEVEAVLQAAADRETPDDETDRRASYHSTRRPAAQASAPSPPEEELWCFCRKPDDGRQMVACDNAKCDLVWWHNDCLLNYIQANRIGTPPPEDDSSNKKWHCPVCIAQEIVNREELGGPEKQRRRRRT